MPRPPSITWAPVYVRCAGVVYQVHASLESANTAALGISESPSGLTAHVLRRLAGRRMVYYVIIAADLDAEEAALVVERAKRVGFNRASVLRLNNE